jgi:DeoR/GlpR family transcriptional regulator of sugar metabolism
VSPEIESKRLVSIQEAARLMSISTDTVRRRYAHKMVRVSKRRLAMRLHDVLHPEMVVD